jgi:hypothetical protein
VKPRRLRPDDDIGRFVNVWLGPDGYTLPFHARYAAYGVAALIFVLIVGIEWVLPAHVGTPPVWEVVEAVIASSLIMHAVDYDKPALQVVTNAAAAYMVRRSPASVPTIAQPRMVDLKITRDSL